VIVVDGLGGCLVSLDQDLSDADFGKEIKGLLEHAISRTDNRDGTIFTRVVLQIVVIVFSTGC
jgi:hypothetical protein